MADTIFTPGEPIEVTVLIEIAGSQSQVVLGSFPITPRIVLTPEEAQEQGIEDPDGALGLRPIDLARGLLFIGDRIIGEVNP